MSEDLIIAALEQRLNLYFNKVGFSPEGDPTTIKERIGQDRGLRFYIYPADHNPPHFHVVDRSEKINASFNIQTGELQKGNASPRDLKIVRYFYSLHRKQIISAWNRNNPDKLLESG